MLLLLIISILFIHAILRRLNQQLDEERSFYKCVSLTLYLLTDFFVCACFVFCQVFIFYSTVSTTTGTSISLLSSTIHPHPYHHCQHILVNSLRPWTPSLRVNASRHLNSSIMFLQSLPLYSAAPAPHRQQSLMFVPAGRWTEKSGEAIWDWQWSIIGLSL